MLKNIGYVDVRYSPQFPKPDQFALMEPKVYNFTSGCDITIYKGFISDGASVPRILWSICAPVDNRVLSAYVLHDYLYIHWEDALKQIKEKGGEVIVEDARYVCDKTMYLLTKEMAPELWFQNWIYYTMVRVFGFSNWNKYRKRK